VKVVTDGLGGFRERLRVHGIWVQGWVGNECEAWSFRSVQEARGSGERQRGGQGLRLDNIPNSGCGANWARHRPEGE
jgi:hypothetical protein